MKANLMRWCGRSLMALTIVTNVVGRADERGENASESISPGAGAVQVPGNPPSPVNPAAAVNPAGPVNPMAPSNFAPQGWNGGPNGQPVSAPNAPAWGGAPAQPNAVVQSNAGGPPNGWGGGNPNPNGWSNAPAANNWSNGGMNPNPISAPPNGFNPNASNPNGFNPNGGNPNGFQPTPVATGNGPMPNPQFVNSPSFNNGQPPSVQNPGQPAPNGAAGGFEQHNGGFFKIMKPAGWQVQTFGSGASFSYVVRDPSCPARQFFVISQCTLLGDEQSKRMFAMSMQQQMNMDVSDAPITSDMSPTGFLRSYNAIARMRVTQQMFPAAPQIENVQIVSSQPMASMYDQVGAKGAVMRATFSERGIPSEGFFFVAVCKYEMMNIGTALNFVGCTAPTGQLEQLQPIAQRCIDSIQFDPQYMQQQQQMQQQSFQAGQARHKAQWDQFYAGQRAHNDRMAGYDAQNAAWWDRQKQNDINHRQWLDGFSGVERVVDPTTNQTYTMNYGDYQQYDMNRQNFEMNNLQQVPYNMQNYDRLNQYAYDGYEYIR